MIDKIDFKLHSRTVNTVPLQAAIVSKIYDLGNWGIFDPIPTTISPLQPKLLKQISKIYTINTQQCICWPKNPLS